MKTIASSELIINSDGSIFHLHLKPSELADKVILVGDPDRVHLIARYFENVECEVANREFKTITGTFQGKRISVISTGIGCDNIDIVMNEIDALANIDFETRTIKHQLKSLDIVRIGTCGGLQHHCPVGSFIASEIHLESSPYRCGSIGKRGRCSCSSSKYGAFGCRNPNVGH